MTLICFASQKGSPGTSAAALAVAAALRPGDGRRKLLLEADLSGGVLAIRYRLPSEPGLVTLAAAARAGLTDEELWRHVGELPGGLPAVVCPDGPEQVHSSLAAAGTIIGRHLAERRDVDAICDLGRLLPGSPAVDLAIEATALLMVARPTAEQLQPAARRMLALRPRIKNLGWLLVGEEPHGPGEVESTFGFPVVGVLADDRRSVEAIEGGAVTKRVRRHPFVRSAATVASTLSDWLAPLAAPPTNGRVDPAGDVEPADDGRAGRSGEALDARPVGHGQHDGDRSAAPIPSPAPPPPGASDRRSPSVPPATSAGRSELDGVGEAEPAFEPTPAAETSRAGDFPVNGRDIADLERPAPPRPPAPPASPSAERPEAPDPFVHDDGDIEWTGS